MYSKNQYRGRVEEIDNMDEKPVDISVVIPVYNEEGNLKELHAKLSNVLHVITENFEIIVITMGLPGKIITRTYYELQGNLYMR
jgi:hypothetical protein